MEGKVYLLRNPIDGVVFYVGQTIYKLSERLRGHISEKGNSVKIKIISEILEKKLLPVIEELECMEYNQECAKILNERELFWIKHYNPIGNRLHVFFCTKKCRMCESDFESKSERKVFCSDICRSKFGQKNKKRNNDNKNYSFKFDKNTHCQYCKRVMNSTYRSKKFCSDKCRVYFNRENVKTEKNPIKNTENLSKAEVWKLIKDGKI